MQRKYIIYTSTYDEHSGGVIALHHLCHLLNQAGETALLWPIEKPIPSLKITLKRLFGFLFPFEETVSGFAANSSFNTPTACYKDLRGSIVVYPEIVSGNPLKIKRIVRWFLNTPGFFTGRKDYQSEELYFLYNPQFGDNYAKPSEENLLKTVLIFDDVYYKRNFGKRKGTCYIMRKGRNREIEHSLDNSILIDSMSHAEISDIFNQVEFCISYDPHTMLSKYAAVCGCISVVIPNQRITKEEWRPREADRYGIAYGFDDVEWARETQSKVLEELKKQQTHTGKQVDNFIKRTKNFFA